MSACRGWHSVCSPSSTRRAGSQTSAAVAAFAAASASAASAAATSTTAAASFSASAASASSASYLCWLYPLLANHAVTCASVMGSELLSSAASF